jgi:hypothetical protein
MPGKKREGPSCDFCSQAAFAIATRDVPGSPALHACKSHLGIATEKLAEKTGAGSVNLYLLSGGSAIGSGMPGVEEITERVRRIGAHSRDDEAAHSMEDALYLAVLAAIAQGAPNAPALATAALGTRRYHFERYTA